MSGGGKAIPLSFLSGAFLLAACVDIPTGANEVLSFEIGQLPSPSVVVGDSLRDSLGVASPISYRAFNYSGDEVVSPVVRFTPIDRGIRVDSITGFVIGDSVRASARILARIRDFTSSVALAVTLRPDTVVGANARDTLSYSLTDTLNVSPALGVRVIHGPLAGDSSVASWRVSFRIAASADPDLAKLVNESSAPSAIDTTDATGAASRRIRLDVTKLRTPVDSVIVEATVRYRGAQVRGSPVRLVLKVKPK